MLTRVNSSADFLTLSLEIIALILKSAETSEIDESDGLYQKFESSKCLEAIEDLQKHANEEIYIQAKQIVEAYDLS